MSGQLRNRIVKRFPSPLGVAEVVLLDVPLDPADWTEKDERALDDLEKRVRND